jgi:Tfp pilus assembly protein PilF
MSEKTEEFLEKLAPCIEKGDLEACVEEASKLAEEMGISGEELLDLSSKLGEEKRYDFAYVSALAASRVLEDDKGARAYYNAGRSASNLKHYEKAEDHYKKAIELDPKLAQAHNNYAILLDDLGRRDEAEDHYKKAIELDPKLAQAHNNYANLLDDLGRRDEAEDHYKKAIELGPKDVLAHNNYANLLRELERFSEAEREVRTALQIEPSNPYALSTLGDILADEKDFNEAEKHYKEALKNSGSMDKSALSEVHNNLGYVYFEMKQNKMAEKQFQKSVSLSGNVKAIRNLRAIKKAETKNSDFRGGLPRYQKCFLIMIILILLGFCYYLFLFWKIEGETRLLSDTMFVAQSSILMGLLIFVLFANQLARLKVGAQGVEMEMSREHGTVEAKSVATEAALKIER